MNAKQAKALRREARELTRKPGRGYIRHQPKGGATAGAENHPSTFRGVYRALKRGLRKGETV